MRRRTALALVVAGAPLAACYRETSDPEEEHELRRMVPLPAEAVLTIAGVRVGELRSDIEARMESVPTDVPVAARPGRFRSAAHHRADVHVVFGTDGRARELYGSQAHVDTRAVVWEQQSPKAVQVVVGPGRQKSLYRPRGSGVISTGQEFAGEELAVDRHGVTWTFIFNKDRRLTGIVARPVAAARAR
jgi:hypothetical protein